MSSNHDEDPCKSDDNDESSVFAWTRPVAMLKFPPPKPLSPRSVVEGAKEEKASFDYEELLKVPTGNNTSASDLSHGSSRLSGRRGRRGSFGGSGRISSPAGRPPRSPTRNSKGSSRKEKSLERSSRRSGGSSDRSSRRRENSSERGSRRRGSSSEPSSRRSLNSSRQSINSSTPSSRRTISSSEPSSRRSINSAEPNSRREGGSSERRSRNRESSTEKSSRPSSSRERSRRSTQTNSGSRTHSSSRRTSEKSNRRSSSVPSRRLRKDASPEQSSSRGISPKEQRNHDSGLSSEKEYEDSREYHHKSSERYSRDGRERRSRSSRKEGTRCSSGSRAETKRSSSGSKSRRRHGEERHRSSSRKRSNASKSQRISTEEHQSSIVIQKAIRRFLATKSYLKMLEKRDEEERAAIEHEIASLEQKIQDLREQTVDDIKLMRFCFDEEKVASEERIRKKIEAEFSGKRLPATTLSTIHGSITQEDERIIMALRNEKASLEAEMQKLELMIEDMVDQNTKMRLTNHEISEMFKSLNDFAVKKKESKRKLAAAEAKIAKILIPKCIRDIQTGSEACISETKRKERYRQCIYRVAQAVQSSDAYDHLLYEEVVTTIRKCEKAFGGENVTDPNLEIRFDPAIDMHPDPNVSLNQLNVVPNEESQGSIGPDWDASFGWKSSDIFYSKQEGSSETHNNFDSSLVLEESQDIKPNPGPTESQVLNSSFLHESSAEPSGAVAERNRSINFDFTFNSESNQGFTTSGGVAERNRSINFDFSFNSEGNLGFKSCPDLNSKDIPSSSQGLKSFADSLKW